MNTSLLKIKNRYKEYLWKANGTFTDEEKNEFLDLLVSEKDGELFFKDIDYASDARTKWDPAKHFSRIHALLKRNGEQRMKNDEGFRKIIIDSLRFWCNGSFKSLNWWQNEICIGLTMGNIALMIEEYLPDDVLEGMKRVTLSQTYKAIPKMNDNLKSSLDNGAQQNGIWVGTNMIWGMSNVLKHGLFVMDDEFINTARTEIGQLLIYTDGEGIHRDGSFYQHGPRWYSGGYGISFVISLTLIVYLLSGTDYSFTEEEMKVYLTHILDGIRHMSHHGYFDLHGVGREHTRPDGINKKVLIPYVEMLINTENIPRRAELVMLLEDLKREAVYVPSDGNNVTKYYPDISHLSHKSQGAYFGITCINEGQRGGEHINCEGVLCYNLSYGTRTCFMARGDEYLNIDPTFDYSHVPGTTCYHETDGELLARDDSWSWRAYQFGGTMGYSLNGSGVVTQYAEHDGISLLAAYFTHGALTVALGADIRNNSGKIINTTIDQCKAQDVVIEKNLAKCGLFTYRDLTDSGKLTVSSKHVIATNKRNSTAQPNEYTVENDVFLCYLSDVQDSYAYSVSLSDKEYEVRVIKNDSDAQAILIDSRLVMAVFHTAGQITVDGRTFKSEAKQILVKELN